MTGGVLQNIAVLILEILKCGGSSPPCPKNVGAWSLKMGTCTSAKAGLISEAFVCPYDCLQDYTNATVWIFMKKK